MAKKSVTGAKFGKGCLLYFKLKTRFPDVPDGDINKVVKEIVELAKDKNAKEIEKIIKDKKIDLTDKQIAEVAADLAPEVSEPGSWEKRTTPQSGAEYQEKVTGVPRDIEYVVKTDLMKSGEKKFDGYNPATNTLIDAKDWDKFPPKDSNGEYIDPILQNQLKSAKADLQIAKSVGSKLEWHVPTTEKAAELKSLFRANGLQEIKIVVTPK